MRFGLFLLALLSACGPLASLPDAAEPMDSGVSDAGVIDAGEPDPYADAVTRFEPGEGAGFGQERMPGVVLGPPSGAGNTAGSTDVVSLGRSGVIELEFTDFLAIDGPGVDLLVFENGFNGFFEQGDVAVSEDGVQWHDFVCDGGCAGLHPVSANPSKGISATDPSVAGGDGFDLADVGLTRVRFVRITDTGHNTFYGPPGGGFDLDAVAIVNGQLP